MKYVVLEIELQKAQEPGPQGQQQTSAYTQAYCNTTHNHFQLASESLFKSACLSKGLGRISEDQ